MTAPMTMPPATLAAPGVRVTFVATVFLGSFLLFLVQPMFARMALPQLGGSPSVWNTAMVFYQATLLAGYAYADRLGRLRQRWQTATHAALFAAAALCLPIGLAAWYPAPGAVSPTLWLIGLMAVSIGLPFLAVSAQAPLMQRWYAHTDAPDAADPYFLYAASNVGSLLALVAYPTLVEPNAGLHMQALGWSAGFLVLLVLILACSRHVKHAAILAADVLPQEKPGLATKLLWLVLAAVPSGLMLAVTTYLTTDIVAMPLLWIIPLALYLVTFIIAFSSRPVISAQTSATIACVLLVLVGGLSFADSHKQPFLVMGALLALVFFVTLALHQQLASRRPGVVQLTQFYFWMSLGGVIGGGFTALLAPLLFQGVYEFPLLLLASAALLTPGAPLTTLRGFFERHARPSLLNVLIPALALVAALVLFIDSSDGLEKATLATPFCAAMLVVTTLAAAGRRWRFTANVAACILGFGGMLAFVKAQAAMHQERGFFGVYRVGEDHANQMRWLTHGTTLHGVESLKPALAFTPLSYYAPASGLGQIARALPDQARVGLVGLGAGSTFCYRKPGQVWTSYEIDPRVVAIATDPRLFRYVQHCAPDARFVIGDARLKLATTPEAAYDALIVDAFSSDSIPLHLLTREAVALYASRVAPNGVLLVHISNRFMDLSPVVADAARTLGLQATLYLYQPGAGAKDRGETRSIWIMLTKSQAVQRAYLAQVRPGWTPLEPTPGFKGWTDDHADILSVLNALKQGA